MMKITQTILLLLTVTITVFAQAPEKMSYQAVIRSQDNKLVKSSPIGLQIIIRQGTASGTSVYQESHVATTNANGLVSLEIGTGTIQSGNFSTIAWENGPYFIEVQADVAGGTTYSMSGTTQLLSVPYALHAKSAERLAGSNGNIVYQPTIIPFTADRDIQISDINNTIACTNSASLTLTADFAAMKIGDIINLEAHNGAVLTILTHGGTTINYKRSGVATFTSVLENVKFGILRKSGDNDYIISGQ
ncbi:hypothetical protein [Flavobacterium nackdongense]|uniref:Uncharacterized protein n=1 Tax=Flavobacterium nackdongense TaxID=2547394 RepID=A0A4P6YBN5_9FLAO|nr:hypothetical protein [Flavobacterium nackdongense]QBN19618.1 hypothetical protein E1750_12680 [Flavobacterium nackdongense]